MEGGFKRRRGSCDGLVLRPLEKSCNDELADGWRSVLGKPGTERSLDIVANSLALGVRTPKHVLLRLFTLVAQIADPWTDWIIPVNPVVGGQSPVEELDNVNHGRRLSWCPGHVPVATSQWHPPSLH